LYAEFPEDLRNGSSSPRRLWHLGARKEEGKYIIIWKTLYFLKMLEIQNKSKGKFINIQKVLKNKKLKFFQKFKKIKKCLKI
jgi:hypothetical protein